MTKIETVLGPISPEQLGITLLHEHVLYDLATELLKKPWFQPSKWPASKLKYLDVPVTMEILGAIKRGNIFVKDNYFLFDEMIAKEELMQFTKWGGKSLVEQSLPGTGRDVEGLKRIANMTGLNIITVTGFYNHWSHPSFIKENDIDDLKEHFVKELTEGIDDTGIKAGAIGECACTEPVPFHDDEKKVLIAAFRAQAEVGCGFTLHPAMFDMPNKRMVTYGELYVDMMEKEDANVGKFYMSHVDNFTWDMDYLRRLLDRGVTLSFDSFGMEYYETPSWPLHRMATDVERVTALVELCKQGYDKQLVMSQDICEKRLLKKYGGYGFSHILENIVSELREWGVKENQIRNMLVENPKRILAY